MASLAVCGQTFTLCESQPDVDGVDVLWDATARCFRIKMTTATCASVLPAAVAQQGIAESRCLGMQDLVSQAVNLGDDSAKAADNVIRNELSKDCSVDDRLLERSTSDISTASMKSTTRALVFAATEHLETSERNAKVEKDLGGHRPPNRLLEEFLEGVARLSVAGSSSFSNKESKRQLMSALCDTVERLADWRWPATAILAAAARKPSAIGVLTGTFANFPTPTHLSGPPAKRVCLRETQPASISAPEAAAAAAAAPGTAAADSVVAARWCTQHVDNTVRIVEEAATSSAEVQVAAGASMPPTSMVASEEHTSDGCEMCADAGSSQLGWGSELSLKAQDGAFPFHEGDVMEDLSDWIDRKMSKLSSRH